VSNGNLYAAFERRFPADRDRAALVVPGGRTWTYAELDSESARLASQLAALGARPGDRITVQVQKSPAAVWLYLACLRAGLVFHPLNAAYRREEIAFLLGDAEPSVAVCDPAAEPLFRELAPATCTVRTLDNAGRGSLCNGLIDDTTGATAACSADDIAVLLYTSGTTGRPKGAMISHGNLASNAATLVEAWGFTAADRLLHALPIYHAHGLLVGLGCTFMSGASLHWLARFDAAEVLREFAAATVFMGVPTYYTRLLAEADLTRERCAGVRLFVSGSAPLSPEAFRDFAARTGHLILERYGMTETGMNSANPLEGERRPGSVGPALPGISIRIATAEDATLPAGDVGEIQVRGPNVFRGYWRQPEKTREAFSVDGWFRTGDQGLLDPDGYLSIVGRSKDLVISGGLNVYPREVEILLESDSRVAEAAVIGVPHPDFGEAVVAVVVPSGGAVADEAGIMAALRGRIAGFKQPKRVFVVSELPRNAMAKVEKAVLRRRYAATFDQENPTS
jgi:malonyl-CoA/methylmalonyl-CoA synthetase